jgi:hypothetical protein
MAVKEEFEIIISKDGGIQVIAKGFQGRECEIPLKNVLKTLGFDEESALQFTEEYRRAMSSSDVEAKIKDK